MLLDGVRPLKAEDGTRQRAEPLLMETSTPDVQASLIIRRCPRQKRLSPTLTATSTFEPVTQDRPD